MCDLLLAANFKYAGVPDLMDASSSSLSTLSTYQNSTSNLDCSFSSNSHAFQNSGVFRKKQAKAATKIQAIARGYLVHISLWKAPILTELAGIQRRKEEELARIELQKVAEMEAFQQEMEGQFALLREKLAEAKQLVTLLSEEKSKYEKENATLKKECKELKKANRELKKDCKIDMNVARDKALLEHRVESLQRQKAKREEAIEGYKKHISSHEAHQKEATEAARSEKEHTQRLKVCISGIFDLVEPKCDSLSRKLLKIADKNKVFL